MTHKPLERDEVQLNIEAADWEDAIRKSARPLVGRHKVTQAYVDEIVRVTREEGPYFIIMKHVALPHAKPEYGALENAVSLTTLKDPVCSGQIYHFLIVCGWGRTSAQHLKDRGTFGQERIPGSAGSGRGQQYGMRFF